MSAMPGPVALVSGAGRGIGRATAVALGRLGYRLALAARTESDLRETAQLARTEAPSLILPADVSNPAQVERVVSQTIGGFGRLDVLVNLAGQAPVRRIEEMTVEQWRGVIDTNLSAVFYLTKAAWPHLRRAASVERPAAIVNVSSLASRDPFDGFAAYGAAKAGVNLFGLAAAREGRPQHIGVYTIAPGAVETSMFREILSPEQFPTEKCLRPEEVAEVIVQCVSGKLRHTSGEVIYLHKSL